MISSGAPDGEGFAYAICHHTALTSALGIELTHPPSDSAFRTFFQQVDAAELCGAIRDWTIARSPVVQGIWIGSFAMVKPCAGPSHPSPAGSAFIAHLTIYASELGVAISQACYATSENHERAVLKKLLAELDLQGLLIQADALHTQKPFFNSSRSRASTSS